MAFADTWFWVAAANPRDQYSKAVEHLGPSLEDARLLTTDEVLVEFLGHFAGLGANLRRKAVEMTRAIMEDPNVSVIPQNRDSFLRGLALYSARPDKGYSIVDCVSMETMRLHAVSEVLTGDHHFTQEGFVSLFLQAQLSDL